MSTHCFKIHPMCEGTALVSTIPISNREGLSLPSPLSHVIPSMKVIQLYNKISTKFY